MANNALSDELTDFLGHVASASDELIFEFCDVSGESVARFAAFRQFAQVKLGQRSIEEFLSDPETTNPE